MTEPERLGDVALYEFGGTADAPPLLISHATGFHAHCYRVLSRHLTDRFHVWAFDHRGHGRTPAPADWTVDWRGYGDDTLAVARALAERTGRPLTGFGHSMGGATLLMAAHAAPALFDRLVLFEPIAFPPLPPEMAEVPPEEFPLVAGARRRRARFESTDAAYANYASKPPLMWLEPEVLRDYVDHGLRPADDAEGGVVLRCAPEHEAETFRTGNTSGAWDLLPEIGTPTTVIGSGDGEGPALIAPEIAKALPHGWFVHLAEQTHFGPMTEPAVVAELIAAAPD